MFQKSNSSNSINLMRSERMTKNIIRFFALFMLCFAIGVTGILAQNQTTGAIGGKVVDPQSAVIPNATVTITNLGTNKVTTVNSSGDGEYLVTNLEPGTYSVEATSGNFAPTKVGSVIVEVGRETSLDLTMSVNGA